jgi:hypothetical protein
MAENYQTYTATIEITYSSEVFDGDPDDVYQLADLEKGWVEEQAMSFIGDFDSPEKDAAFVVVSVVPEIGE